MIVPLMTELEEAANHRFSSEDIIELRRIWTNIRLDKELSK